MRHEEDRPLSVLSEKQQELLQRYRKRETFATIINSILVEHNLKSRDLAFILGASKSDVTRWVGNRRITDKYLRRLVGIFPEITFDRAYRAMELPEIWVQHQAELMEMTPSETDQVLRFLNFEGFPEPEYLVDRFNPFKRG